MYLVDTNVVSAGAPRRAQAAELIVWMDEHSADLYLSAVTVAEIEDDIAKIRRQGAGRRAGELRAWLETLLHLYAARILPLDVAVARVTGTLSDLARSKGVSPGFADLVIAATARFHGLTILTANTRHFAPLGVASHNPFRTLPDRRTP